MDFCSCVNTCISIVGNILIKMICSCGKEDLLYCTCCQQNFAVKLAGFSLSAATYDSLYTTTIDIWSFGCLLLDGFIGKCRTTESNFEVCMSSHYFVLVTYVVNNMCRSCHFLYQQRKVNVRIYKYSSVSFKNTILILQDYVI